MKRITDLKVIRDKETGEQTIVGLDELKNYLLEEYKKDGYLSGMMKTAEALKLDEPETTKFLLVAMLERNNFVPLKKKD